MCGIAGWLSWQAPPDEAVVGRMADAQAHRGPDARGVVARGPIALGHRRLAIIDLDRASDQPMTLPGSGLWIVFNGEIYNFRELRKELEAAGAAFRTRGDTEVILQAYVRWGADCLGRLIGMFAFALWDEKNRRLFLARDRAGKKPLYYQWTKDGGMIFASELKGLSVHREAAREVNPRALGHYLALNHTLTDACILKGVEKLPAGHCLTVEQGRRAEPIEYWDLAHHFHEKRRYRNESEAADTLDALLEDATRLRLVSDVPLGAFLSGGVDSSAVVAAMARLEPADRTHTFSIGFSEDTYGEVLAAREAARFLGVDHRDETVDVDMAAVLPAVVRACDEPFADTSAVPTYHLARFARRNVTVCLSGDGGDELFAGYHTYIADRLHDCLKWLPGWLGRGLGQAVDAAWPADFDKVGPREKLIRFLGGSGLDFRRAHAGWRTIFTNAEKIRLLRPEHQEAVASGNPARVFDRHYDRVAGCHFLDQAMYADIKTWLVDDILVKVDRATMAHSLEARAPLLDHRVIEFAASLPVGWKLKGLSTKHVFKQSQRRHLPASVIDRDKRGFNAPVSHWLAGRLGDLAYEASSSARMREWFEPAAVEALWRDHRARRRDNGLKLFGLTCLGLWMEQ